MKKIAILMVVLMLALPMTAFGEGVAYDLTMLSITIPEGYDVFVRSEIGPDNPLAEKYDMDYIQTVFDASPEMVLDAYHPELGHDLMVVIVPVDSTIDLNTMTDNMIETLILPYAASAYADMGGEITESTVEHLQDVTYMRVLASFLQGDYQVELEQYYTTITYEGVGYGITIKAMAYNEPVSEEMHADLVSMVESTSYNAD